MGSLKDTGLMRKAMRKKNYKAPGKRGKVWDQESEKKKCKGTLWAWGWEGKCGQKDGGGVGSHSLFNIRKSTDW